MSFTTGRLENVKPYNYAYADATARAAATGFVAADVGKVALQIDNATLWTLTDDSPATWVQVPGPHTHAAADIASGTVATARLGGGTADATTFLRGDQTWATPAGGSALTVEEVDGSPTDSAVTKIVFPNGTLGIASHVATYTPAAGSSGALTSIASTTLGSAAASVTFSSIPGTYKHLWLIGAGRGDDAGTLAYAYGRFNGDTAANYDWEIVSASGSAASAAEFLAATSGGFGTFPAAGAPAAVGTGFDAMIYDYAGTTFQKSWSSRVSLKLANSSGNIYSRLYSGQWRSASAITSITVLASAGNFAAGCTFQLYGVA